MKLMLFTIILLVTMSNKPLVDFNKDSNISNWKIVDDGVMGGLSEGKFTLTENGHAKFHGTVRLENNGGFSSVRYSFNAVDVSSYSKVCIRLKGDGKPYQFRVKDNVEQYFSYKYTFETSGNWETIEIPLGEMYPGYRGRNLDKPNFSADKIEEVVFLIGNKKKEQFELLLDAIVLK